MLSYGSLATWPFTALDARERPFLSSQAHYIPRGLQVWSLLSGPDAVIAREGASLTRRGFVVAREMF